MKNWTKANIIVGAVIGILGIAMGSGGILAWQQFHHMAPIENQAAIRQSLEAQMSSAEKRGDGKEVERLLLQLEQQEEAFRAQIGLRRFVSPKLPQETPTYLSPEEMDELRILAAQAKMLLKVSAEDWLIVGNAYYMVDNYNDALDMYSKVIALQPNSAEAYGNSVMALTQLKRYQEAIDMFDKLKVIDPELAMWYSVAAQSAQIGLEFDRRRSAGEKMPPEPPPIPPVLLPETANPFMK